MTQTYAITLDRDKCTGCGQCVLACPADVIRMDDKGLAKLIYPKDCQVCYLCEDDCPTQAIHLSHDISNSRRFSIYDDPSYVFDWDAAEKLKSK